MIISGIHCPYGYSSPSNLPLFDRLSHSEETWFKLRVGLKGEELNKKSIFQTAQNPSMR